jgi:hypothetical protein
MADRADLVVADPTAAGTGHFNTVQHRGHFTLSGFLGSHVLPHFGHVRAFGMRVAVFMLDTCTLVMVVVSSGFRGAEKTRHYLLWF